MGNDQSLVPHDEPPTVLENRDMESVAKYIKSANCTNVFFMVGAGISTAAGIPDFRSPETGLYANLARLNLPYPEAVFEITFFRENPAPFYTLAKELDPAAYRPTLSHAFIRLFAEPPPNTSARLHTCFSQNIDTLERRAGVPPQHIIEAHGSFADQHCIECHAEYDGTKMREMINKGEVAHCAQCDGLVKPDIVFFGESLPAAFSQAVPHLRTADLLIVMGTSLKVHPFAALTRYVDESCPRVLINLEPAGDIGTRADDVLLLGKCDEVVRDLCRELGPEWEAKLDALWAETAPQGESAAVKKQEAKVGVEAEDEDKRVLDEVERMTERIGKALDLSEDKDGKEVKGEKLVNDQEFAARGERVGMNVLENIQQKQDAVGGQTTSGGGTKGDYEKAEKEEEVPGGKGDTDEGKAGKL